MPACADNEPAPAIAISAAKESTTRFIQPPEVELCVGVFGNDPHGIADNLQETAVYGETVARPALRDRERARSEQRQERCVSRQNPDQPVVRRGYDARRVPIEQRPVGGDQRDAHHADASCLACSTTSSMRPTM